MSRLRTANVPAVVFDLYMFLMLSVILNARFQFCTLIFAMVFSNAGVAQLVEQLTRNEQVRGSNPRTSSGKIFNILTNFS
jgi:hypothetical protein